MLRTAKLRARVHAWRRAPAPAPIDAEASLAAVQARFPRVKKVNAGAAIARAVEGAIARYGSDAGAAGLDVETEAAAAAILAGPAPFDAQERLAPLLDVWIAREGPAFALAALLRAGELDVHHRGGALEVGAHEIPHFYFASGFVGAWRGLRERLTAHDDAGYRAARDQAAALREGASQLVRCVLAYTFPLEGAWARTEAAAPVEPVMQRSWPLAPLHLAALVSSLDEVEALRSLFAANAVLRGHAFTHDHVYTAFDRLGDAGSVAALAELFAKGASVQEKLDLAAILGGSSSPGAARALVALFGDPRVTRAARAELDRDPVTAIGAIAEAIAAAPRRSKPAMEALTALAAKHPQAVAEVAPSLGEAAQKVLAPWAAEEHLLKDTSRSKKKSAAPEGPWLDRAALPRPILAGGEPMSDEALAKLLDALARGKPGSPPAAVRDARAACDPSSLSALGLAIFAQWVRGRAPRRDSWAAFAAAALGDDATPRELASFVRRWSREGSTQAMLVALSALAAVPSDRVLVELHKLTASSGALLETAQALLDREVEKRGLDVEDLHDRLVPDCGLGDGEEITLDFGPRSFRVRFDEHLVPELLDAEGERLATLPKPNRRDDAEKAALAVERWSGIKETLRDVVSGESKRLEHAMRSRRRWTLASFREAIVAHPVLGRLARRVIWASYEGASPLLFRVAEDRTFADVNDAAVTVRGPIGVPHPVEMDPALRAAWAQILGDYGLAQPFAQIGRETHTVRDDERGGR
jgi:hypothetical protein